MIKVLMVGNSSSVKGGITTVINQFRNFNFKEHNIKLKFIPTYIETNNLFKILYFFVAYIRIFLTIIFNKPGVIHIHMSYRGSFSRAYAIQKLALKFKIRNIIHLHGSEFKKWYDSVNSNKQNKIKYLMKNCDNFIVLGQLWNEIIKEIEPDTKTIILNNSVNVPTLNARYMNKKTILFLGVLIKRKGVHDLLEAIKKIDSDNYTILIAGSGEEELNLKKMVTESNIKNVEFLGWVDKNEKESLLLKSQFMILPTYNEGLPMSILEAMSYGVPVVSTYVGDIPTVIKNNENGFLYKAGNINDLTRILDDIIKMKENEWNKLSKEAKNTIKKSYTEKTYFDKVINIYKK